MKNRIDFKAMMTIGALLVGISCLSVGCSGGGAGELDARLGLPGDGSSPSPETPVGTKPNPALLKVDPELIQASPALLGENAEFRVSLKNEGQTLAQWISLANVELGGTLSFRGGFFPGISGTCEYRLAPGASCEVVLNWRPLEEGVQSGTLPLSYHDGVSFKTFEFRSQGEGLSVVPVGLELKAPQGLPVAQCIPLQIQSLSSALVPAKVSAATTVDLVINNESAGASNKFYSEDSCQTAVTQVTLSAGQSQAALWFKSSAIGQFLTLIAKQSAPAGTTAAPALKAMSATVAISGPSLGLRLLLDPQIQKNQCVGFDLLRVDQQGYPVGDLAELTVGFKSTGTYTLSNVPQCDRVVTEVKFKAGQDRQRLWLKASATGDASLEVYDIAGALHAASESFAIADTVLWWNDQWKSRIKVSVQSLIAASYKNKWPSVSNQGGVVPVLVKLDAQNFPYPFAQLDGSDLRFVDSDHQSLLPFELEKYDALGESHYWVELPSITDSNGRPRDFWIYFNNKNLGGEVPPTTDALASAGSPWARTEYASVWHFSDDLTQPVASSQPQPQPQPLVKDSLGVRHGTPEGGPKSVKGVLAGAVDLNGAQDAIDVGRSLTQIVGGNSTVSFWINSQQSGHDTNWRAPAVMGVEQHGGTNDMAFGWIDVAGYINVSAGIDGIGAKSRFKVNEGAWRHVTITRNAQTGRVRFYINGVLNGDSLSGKGVITTPFSKIGLVLSTNGVTKANLNAQLDELRISPVEFTPEKVWLHYQMQNGRSLQFGSF